MPGLNILIRSSLCFLFIFLPLHNLDQWFYDKAFTVRGKQRAGSPILLVRVNSAKLQRYLPEVATPQDSATSTPPIHAVWHYSVYERALQQIEAANPQLIIVTTFFGSVDNRNDSAPEHPHLHPKVVLSSRVSEESKLILPPALIREESYGYNNLFPDADNVLRRARLVYSSSDSIALRAYHKLKGEFIERDVLQPMWIDFVGPANTFPSVELTDLLEGKIPNEQFEGKIILLGTERGTAGSIETPFGRLSSLEIHANVLDTLLNEREITHTPTWLNYVLSGIAIVASASIILSLPLKLGWISVLGLFIILILFNLVLFSFFKIWASTANPIVSIFGTYLLMLGFKLGRQEEEQWRIQQEAKQLKEMDQFKNNFISLFSHDLKTPISKIKAIINRTQIENPDLSSGVQQSFSALQRTNDELARRISDILKVTKMETMSLKVQKEVIDLNRMVEEEAQKLKFLADEKNIEVVLDLEPLFSMEGDQVLVQEVLMNLIENALKYSEPDKRVIIRTREEDNKVNIEVIDEGPGISKEEIPRVTGKFFRGKNTMTKTKGSGLGLYLAKYFVELHSGTLEIESELGKGTCVRFSLPIGN